MKKMRHARLAMVLAIVPATAAFAQSSEGHASLSVFRKEKADRKTTFSIGERGRPPRRRHQPWFPTRARSRCGVNHIIGACVVPPVSAVSEVLVATSALRAAQRRRTHRTQFMRTSWRDAGCENSTSKSISYGGPKSNPNAALGFSLLYDLLLLSSSLLAWA